ncbi:TBC1 domain family member 4 isoform X1 [Musca domestica]|uniref:TBC1 domain family member 4 isoform X1 n=1 Tax=Musca domestica TaxID=7370 RepID=A0A9J7ID09_MUSDO|nr:TBC1 domain family member 4 isoform X1 [Musca domestica]
MKTRLVSLTYRGSASVDPRYSAAMLPWTINDIRSTESYSKLSVGIENGNLESYNSDFELQFSHPLKHIVGMCRIVHKQGGKQVGNGFMQLKTPQQQQSLSQHSNGSVGGNGLSSTSNGFKSSLKTSTSYGSLSSSAAASYQQQQQAQQQQQQANDDNGVPNNFMEFTGPITGLVYLMKEPKDPLLHIYLFECDAVEEMAELMHQMRDPAHTLGGSVGSIPQTLVANSSGAGAELTMQKLLAGNGIHTTPATNLKMSEAMRQQAQHEASPTLAATSSKMKSSKSYTHGLSNSAGTVNIPTSTSAQSNLSLLADISPNHTHFFEVMYVGKIRVSHKRVPYSFIDDALPKFKAYDAQRQRLMQMSSNRKMSMTSEGAFVGAGTLDLKNCSLKDHDVKEEDEEEAEREDAKRLQEKKEESKKDEPEGDEEPAEKVNVFVKAATPIPGATGDSEANTADSTDADLSDQGDNKTLEDYNKENKLPVGNRLMRGISQLDIPLKKDESQSHIDENEPLPSNVIINQKHPSPPRQDQESEQASMTIAQPQDQQTPEAQQNNTTSQQRQHLHPNHGADNLPKQRDRSASYGCIPPYVEQNRTMVFLVGRSDLRLISPDRKQVLLYKDFKDVASCAQGQKNADHFGIICREAHNDGYIGYVFKCQSDHVCDDIVAAISQAFVTCAEQKKKEATQIFSCDHCPMLWYHKLCTDVEGLSEKKTQAMIFRRIETLTDDEQDTIWAKFYGSEKMTAPLQEQNQFLMMLLRAHCESRQQRHVHDTAENRSEFLNQYLGGSTIFMKAKRSLTNSFDHLLKRKASKDDIGANSLQVKEHKIRESSAEPKLEGAGGGDSPPEGFRSRSNTIGGTSPSKPQAEQLKSPMMDIFMKVGNSPKVEETHQGSWRQAILNSVVTPSKGMDGTDGQSEYLSPMRITQPKIGKRTREELRELWKTAIRQTILLNRMETENAMLQARQNENELKRMKLDYEEIVPCDRQLIERWDTFIERDSMKIGNKRDPIVLAQAIKTGVPRSKRGEVWSFLAEQHSMYTAPVDTKKFPNFNTPYHALLKNLTEHQHAIFIDLGRTFPNHKFYKDPLGLGQLSLFNLLKAYSILDPELGYCQGLGFICGILLLHCEEAEAFQLLKHLMFHRQMRTKYLPDMKKFQLQLYQLSRLVKDHLPSLYVWLDQNDVSPTLYAAPWILTVFSSQFPLGFVARVFDLMFLESSEVIFKFAIALLTVHESELLARENFEEIMDYLKTVVPKIDAKTMEKVLKMVFTLDINKQLMEYNVEYNVLQEEITSTNHHLEMLNQEKSRNSHLEQQLQFAQSSIVQLEKTRSSQQSQITNLQSQVQTLELTIQTLGRYVSHLAERNIDLEIPQEVRRILQQLDDLEKQQRRRPLFTERKIGKSVSVNSHLGFPLKVLEELNEKEEHGSPQKTKKTPYFENTYEQLRQQKRGGGPLASADATISPTRQISAPTIQQPQSPELAQPQRQMSMQQPQQRPNRLYNDKGPNLQEMQSRLDELKLPEHVDRYMAQIKSPLEVDSGVGTPLSPPSTSSNSSQSSSLSSGSIFSRMGYKNTPAVFSPNASRQLFGMAASNEVGGSTSPAKAAAVPPAEEPKLPEVNKTEAMHPLSMVGEVNVRFNGTTQLKSIRPVHHVKSPVTPPATKPHEQLAQNVSGAGAS